MLTEGVGVGDESGGEPVEGDGERVVLHGRPGEQWCGAFVVDEHEPDPCRGDEALVVGMLRAAGRCAEGPGAQRFPVAVADPAHRPGERAERGVLPGRRRTGRPAERRPVPGRPMTRAAARTRGPSAFTQRSAEPPHRSSAIAASVASSGRTHVGSLHGTPIAVRSESTTNRGASGAAVAEGVRSDPPTGGVPGPRSDPPDGPARISAALACA